MSAVNPLPTDLDTSPISRPTTLTTPVAVRNDDDTYTVYNQNIVNETDSTIFNPVTNITTVFTDWVFDYSTRTYTLTLEDGSIVTVIYGDDCMTIIQGDQEYTVYYVIPSEEDPGADPDVPGTDDGSGWAWLQGAWTEMMDKLTGILEAITDMELSPEINVDVEVGGEEEVTQESWFSELLTKFAFITSVHDIYTQLVADVTSDAATAAAVADGAVMLADVTSGHAAIDGSTSYTAPELAISFGSSDKYGVDWAGIRPLNLSWYAPHKETVDGILSGILWLSYLFLLIKRAPGIIRGAEMVTEDRIKIYDWHMRNDP